MMNATLAKSAHGQDCNNCGLCCIDQLCPLAAALFSKDDADIAPESAPGPCPALESVGGGKFICGLSTRPEAYFPVRAAIVGKEKLKEATLILIGAGTGCDAHIDGEPYNVLYRDWLQEWANKREKKIRRAKIAWGFEHVGLGRF